MNVSAVDGGDRGEGYSPVSGDDGGCLDTSGNESIPDLAVHSPETPSSDLGAQTHGCRREVF